MPRVSSNPLVLSYTEANSLYGAALDGVITAPGAAAQMPLSLMGQAPDAAGGLWF
ncbi:hypothetical protein [Verminephrobacter aporrectodeae]|uniref:hypothetical protein n=1 Tax=Verminephrobacter aporrectodeae TaxID=1110389 RepID=UPI0002376585|nr:hypothetical protein [Verminephrobacter aporrectodeae]